MDEYSWQRSVDESLNQDVSFSNVNGGATRKEKKWYHDVADFANLLKSFIGTNYLSLAFGIKLAGLGLGLGGLLLISALTAHCCHLIVKVKYHAIEKTMSKKRALSSSGSSMPGERTAEDKAIFHRLQRTMTYVDVGRMTYGRWGAWFVQFFLVVTQIGFCVNYHIFIGSNIYSLIVADDNSSAVPAQHDDALVQEFNLQNESSLFVQSSNGTTTPPDLHHTIPWIPPLPLLVILPLPIFILFTLFRNVRIMGFVSLIANVMMTVGYFIVVIYIISTFELAGDLKWAKWATFPVFLGQAASSYEAIGTLLSIEASMDGNHRRYPVCLYSVVGVFSSMLTLSAVLGYLKYGEATAQILVQNLPQTGALIITVNAALLVAVVFTYPLQVYPVIEILEAALFAKGGLCGPKRTVKVNESNSSLTDVDEKQPLLDSQRSDTEHASLSHVGKRIPDSVATWKRNTFRVCVALLIGGLAVVFKDVFAYINAFVGAVGSCPLAFVLPCLFHLKLCGFKLSRAVIVKDIIIMITGTVIGIVSLVVVIQEIVQNV